MNKSLLIQNGIAGGIAGTVADGLFNNEDEHHYAKSAFMGTLAGVGATALHQSLPSENKVVKATAEHKPPVPATPEAQAAPTPVPKPAPVVKAEAAPAPKPPEPVVPKAEPQPAPMKITPIEPKQAEPPKAVVPVKPSEEPKQEFVGPKDKPLSRKLTKTINSVKQTASGINNGIVDGARRLSATAAQLKIPPIQINVPQISQNIREKGRTVASGLARSAQALSIAAIASMDMGGGHAVVQHAFETAGRSVQVQASMATSGMTKAVNNITEAVGNYHPMQGVENAIKNAQATPKAAQSTVSLPKVIQPVEEPKTANVELLVGGPYKDKVTGETHPYGHVALVVHGHMPDKTKYSKVYDYGRYGKHSGPFGEGILREWNDPTKYINSENLTGRTTTGFTYPASEQEAQNIVKHFESLKSGSKLLSSGKKGNLVPNNVYKLNHDYDAANSNCVTVSLGGLISGMPKLGNRLNSPAFEQLSTLSKVEQLGMQAAHNTNLLMLPASLKFAATKVGGAKTSMYSASSAKRSAPKLANIPVKPKKSAAKLTTNVNAVKKPNA